MERPQQPDRPTTVPTPEDPRETTPMQDPPLQPEQDNPTRIADAPGERPGNDQESVRGFQANDDESSDLEANGANAIRPDNASPDRTVFDENRSAR